MALVVNKIRLNTIIKRFNETPIGLTGLTLGDIEVVGLILQSVSRKDNILIVEDDKEGGSNG